jgi:glycosyltransferase involved in cell wall biosynthesis
MVVESMLPVSVVIITLNEERAISRCLSSVSFAEEIIVVDSGSTDRTVEIAESYGAKVIKQEWLGYGKQKQFAVNQATHDWVYCLDADEWVSDKLERSIHSLFPQPEFFAYESPRCNKFLGRWLRHGEGYPDYNLRLFHRQHARWTEDVVHEHVYTDAEIGRIDGDLMHESEEGVRNYLDKQSRYTDLQAKKLASLNLFKLFIKMVFSPFVRFIKFYIFKLGFLDGVSGLLHIMIGCFNSFEKNMKAIKIKVSYE